MRSPVDPQGQAARRAFVEQLRSRVRALRAEARSASEQAAETRAAAAETDHNERLAARAASQRALLRHLADLNRRRTTDAQADRTRRRTGALRSYGSVAAMLEKTRLARVAQGRADARARRAGVAANATWVTTALRGYRERRQRIETIRAQNAARWRSKGKEAAVAPPPARPAPPVPATHPAPPTPPTRPAAPSPPRAPAPRTLARPVVEVQVSGLPEVSAAAPRETSAPAHHQDDLTVLQGIGPGIHRRLADAGITTFARLAVCTNEELYALFGLQLAFASWIEQARARARAEAA